MKVPTLEVTFGKNGVPVFYHDGVGYIPIQFLRRLLKYKLNVRSNIMYALDGVVFRIGEKSGAVLRKRYGFLFKGARYKENIFQANTPYKFIKVADAYKRIAKTYGIQLADLVKVEIEETKNYKFKVFVDGKEHYVDYVELVEQVPAHYMIVTGGKTPEVIKDPIPVTEQERFAKEVEMRGGKAFFLKEETVYRHIKKKVVTPTEIAV